MLVIENNKINLTRGDACTIQVSATNGGTAYTFASGDTIRLNVMEAKNTENIVLTKDVTVTTAGTTVSIPLTSSETKIDEYINKPKTYWYEIILNATTSPQTIIGYDSDGAKEFILYPEGDDVSE